MSEEKKLYIKTYGCQMNVYDSERMSEALAQEGYTQTQDPEAADMILLNTCHIRENASEKIFSELGRYRPLKQARPDLKLGVAGCVAQAEGAEIMRRQPMVDLVVGPQSYHRLGQMARDMSDGHKVIDTDFPEEDKFAHLSKRKRTQTGPSAFLTVQEGCDKFCAFCVVPYTRGAEASRPARQILEEARALCDANIREITLLGQNVNAYHGEGVDGKEWDLARLIYALSEIEPLARIRYTTSHPNDMTPSLIKAHQDCEKLMPYLHLPVQSGSDRILKRMNRRHTAQQYIDIISKIREARPDILISGDFIVGFPEEDERDFEATLELVRRVEYGQCYSFKYSTRPGTPAAERKQVEEAVKTARLAELQSLLSKQQLDRQAQMVGQKVHVLFEKKGREADQMVGKSDHLHAVFVKDETIKVGDLREVNITASAANSLQGSLSVS